MKGLKTGRWLFLFFCTCKLYFHVRLVCRQDATFPQHFSWRRQTSGVHVTFLPGGVRAELRSLQVCLSGSDAGWFCHHFLWWLAAVATLVHTGESCTWQPWKQCSSLKMGCLVAWLLGGWVVLVAWMVCCWFARAAEPVGERPPSCWTTWPFRPFSS